MPLIVFLVVIGVILLSGVRIIVEYERGGVGRCVRGAGLRQAGPGPISCLSFQPVGEIVVDPHRVHGERR